MSSVKNRILGPAEGLKHQLATAMAGTFALTLASKFLMFGTTVLLARLMGVRNYGVYAAAVAVVRMVEVPVSLGLPYLIVREVAVYRTHDAWGLMKGLVLRSNQYALLVSALFMIVLYGLQPQLKAYFGFDTAVFWITFALLPLMLLSAMRMAALRGMHYIVLGLAPETLVMPCVFIIEVLILGASTHVHLSPFDALAARLVAVACAFAVGMVFLLAKMPKVLRTIKAQYPMIRWVRSAGPLMWVATMNVITMQTGVVMLATLRGPVDAGIYQVAVGAAELVALASVISNITLQPTLARLYAQGELNKLKQVARSATRIMFVLALLAAALFIGAGAELLKLFYGEAYAGASMALGILSAGWALIALMGPVRETLIMTGGEKATAISISVSAILNIVLCIALIPRLGVSGAALATTTSLICCYAGYAIAVRRRLSFWLSPL